MSIYTRQTTNCKLKMYSNDTLINVTTKKKITQKDQQPRWGMAKGLAIGPRETLRVCDESIPTSGSMGRMDRIAREVDPSFGLAQNKGLHWPGILEDRLAKFI